VTIGHEQEKAHVIVADLLTLGSSPWARADRSSRALLQPL
jgi:hypothetical protein